MMINQVNENKKNKDKKATKNSFSGSNYTASDASMDVTTAIAVDVAVDIAVATGSGIINLVSHQNSNQKIVPSDFSGLETLIPGEKDSTESWSGITSVDKNSVTENWSGISEPTKSDGVWSGITQEAKEMGASGAAVHVDAAVNSSDISIFDSVVDGASEALTATGDMIGSVASGAVDVAGAVLTGTGDVIGSVASGAADVAGAVISGTGEVIGAIFSGLS